MLDVCTNSLPASMLVCSDVTVRFGGVVALNAVSCGWQEGQITAVIGPNGAGKTTLLNAVTGMVEISGEITLDAERIESLEAFRRARKGVLRTFQNLEIFTNMTVLENVLAGRHRLESYSLAAAVLKTPRYRREERAAREEAMQALAFVGLADKANEPAGELPYGSQRMLEIARVIAARPRLLLLDEPAAGLNMKETRELGTLIRRIRDELGITVALVEHDMELVMGISDHIVVLSFGEVLATGTPLEIQKNPDVIAAYLGTDDDDEGGEESGHGGNSNDRTNGIGSDSGTLKHSGGAHAHSA